MQITHPAPTRQEALRNDFWVLPEVGAEFWGVGSGIRGSRPSRVLSHSLLKEHSLSHVLVLSVGPSKSLSLGPRSCLPSSVLPLILSAVPPAALGSSLSRVNYSWNLYLSSLAEVLFPRRSEMSPPQVKPRTQENAESQG